MSVCLSYKYYDVELTGFGNPSKATVGATVGEGADLTGFGNPSEASVGASVGEGADLTGFGNPSQATMGKRPENQTESEGKIK